MLTVQNVSAAAQWLSSAAAKISSMLVFTAVIIELSFKFMCHAFYDLDEDFSQVLVTFPCFQLFMFSNKVESWLPQIVWIFNILICFSCIHLSRFFF
jgi:hypothetical protein